jgi:hypothetical protein
VAVAPREEVGEGRDSRHGAEDNAEEQGEGHGAQCTQTAALEKCELSAGGSFAGAGSTPVGPLASPARRRPGPWRCGR